MFKTREKRFNLVREFSINYEKTIDLTFPSNFIETSK